MLPKSQWRPIHYDDRQKVFTEFFDLNDDPVDIIKTFLSAMEDVQQSACVDYLDAFEDGGKFWCNAIDAAKDFLKSKE